MLLGKKELNIGAILCALEEELKKKKKQIF